jgi:SAM-dependent methyltransferase
MEQAKVEGFFYPKRHALTLNAAKTVFSIVSARFGFPRSVLDVGCGVGTWLYAARANGATKLLGIEGTWIDEVRDLVVPREIIKAVNLEDEWSADLNFELSISLEVAEHLSPGAGSRLVKQLCNASPLVLFSAAVPGQGGNGHVNEQWPEYWQKEFARNEYRSIDCVRPLIWNKTDIPWWYQQNILIFAREDIAGDYYLAIASRRASDDLPVLGIQHPPMQRSILRRIARNIKHRFSSTR